MITNDELIELLTEWSFWQGRTAPKSVSRLVRLPVQLACDIVLIIQGVRRCGKSTLLSQLPQHYHLDREHCYYCNFEDPRLLGSLDYRLLEAIVQLADQRSGPVNACYFFLDEIQNVEGWEKWLHTQLERPKNRHFVITGSNSVLLSGEFASALTGRHMTVELYPFNFSEYKQVFPRGDLQSYCQQGGFPRPLLLHESKNLLREYFNDIILRDVQKRVRARSAELIKQVVKMAFDSCGSELSYRKIAAVSGLSIDTVRDYLDACEQAYLMFSCQYFSFSEKKRLARNKKFYPIDPGMRAAITTTTNDDIGKSLESLVFLHLKQHHEQVFYWRDQGEVDFVTLSQQTITPYQVSCDHAKKRHHQALEQFYAVYPQAQEAVLITLNDAERFLSTKKRSE